LLFCFFLGFFSVGATSTSTHKLHHHQQYVVRPQHAAGEESSPLTCSSARPSKSAPGRAGMHHRPTRLYSPILHTSVDKPPRAPAVGITPIPALHTFCTPHSTKTPRHARHHQQHGMHKCGLPPPPGRTETRHAAQTRKTRLTSPVKTQKDCAPVAAGADSARPHTSVTMCVSENKAQGVT
jgi:hypothetical protein